LEITPEAAFLTERFSFKAEEVSKAGIGLAGKIKPEDLLLKEAPKGCTVSFVFQGKDQPRGPIWEERQKLLREKARLEEKLEVLSAEEAWLKEGGKAWLKRGALKELPLLSARLEKGLAEKATLKERLSILEKEIQKKEFTYFRPLFSCETPQDTYILALRYPVKIQERLRRFLWARPQKGSLRYRIALILEQDLDFDLKQIKVLYYALPWRFQAISPPPFIPWYVDQRPPLKAPKAPALKLQGLQALPPEPRKVPLGKLYALKGVDLPAGTPRLLILEEREFPARYLVEVPAYAYPRALMAVRFTPDTYIPKGDTRIFLDQIELSPRVLPAFFPGKETFIYLGEDPWLKVKKKVLKDFNEGEGVFKKKRKHLRIWQIKIKSFHPKPVEIKLVERIPVSHRKEIKVLAQSDPPWDELSPEGKALWHFRLSPKQTQTVTIKTVVEYPSP